MEELHEKSKAVKDYASMPTAHLELQVRRPSAESVQQLLCFFSKSCVLIQSIDARPPIPLKYHLVSDLHSAKPMKELTYIEREHRRPIIVRWSTTSVQIAYGAMLR